MSSENKSNWVPFEKTRRALSEMWGIKPEEVELEDVIAVLCPRTNCILQGSFDKSSQKKLPHRILDTNPSVEGVITQSEK